MIILRKDKLQLVEPDHEFMTRAPKLYDFEKDKDSAENVAKVLFEKMKTLGGVGLSANQVGLDMKVFVMGQDEFGIYVFNPEILKYKGENQKFEEGCLSYPGLMLLIDRPLSIDVRYQNVKGEVVEVEYTGLTARIFQHEYDHMMGRNFTDRVSKLKLDFAKKKFENKRQKIIKKYAVKTMIDALNAEAAEKEAGNLEKVAENA